VKIKSINEIQGHCQRCEAPVFLNRSDDQYGNTVATLNCWNGHYQWINIEGIESDLPVEKKIQISQPLVKRISFFELP
jgi:hypothetical protein|tara:strand:- start:6193 stop:6426 length:234 start_codon:yes stop_codon:yes gene_type:complete